MFVGEARASTRISRESRSSDRRASCSTRCSVASGSHAPTSSSRTSSSAGPPGQSRPAARGDRRLRAAPLPPDRADRAEARRDARELRHEAPVRKAGRDHAGSWVRAGGHARRSTVLLYPLFHPAAALYTPSMLKVLEEDFERIPALLGRALDEPEAPEQPDAAGRAGARVGPARPLLTWPGGARQRLGGRDGAVSRQSSLARLRSRRRRHRLRRARRRQDDLRPRRLSRARGDRAGHEPDLHHRSPLRGRECPASPTSTSTASPLSRRRSGATSSRTSTTRSSSSNGPRRASGCFRTPGSQ